MPQTRALFERHLMDLRNDVVDMGSRTEQAIRWSMDHLPRPRTFWRSFWFRSWTVVAVGDTVIISVLS